MKRRLGTIDGLRGVAALGVAWYHFTHGSGLLHGGWLYNSGLYGWVGVEMFFVISGFIIPYSLYRAGYRSRNFGQFLVKRVARLDPPYFADILLCIALSYIVPLAPGFRGEWPHYTWAQLAAHIAYVNSIVHKPWVNVVFWSLGIEFQYYLLIGALFPLLVARRNAVRFGFLGLLLVLSALIHSESLVFRYFPLFVAGILTFQCKADLVSTRTLLSGLLVTGVVSCLVNGPVTGCVGMATALIIRFVRLGSSRLTDFGLISYSLYLLHVPIGGKIMNLGGRFAHGTPALMALLATAVAASVTAAAIFYRYVELPSQRLSSSIRYRGGREAPSPSTVATPAARPADPVTG
jgi:peptidoglycan/LPS O-acetylase OafA/YrhL